MYKINIMAKKHDYMLRIRDIKVAPDEIHWRVSEEPTLPCNYDKYGKIQCKKVIQKGPGAKIIYCNKEVNICRARDVRIYKRVECNAQGSCHPVLCNTSFIGVCDNARYHNDCKPLIICKQCMEKCIGGAQTWTKRKKFPYSTEYWENFYSYAPKKR